MPVEIQYKLFHAPPPYFTQPSSQMFKRKEPQQETDGGTPTLEKRTCYLESKEKSEVTRNCSPQFQLVQEERGAQQDFSAEVDPTLACNIPKLKHFDASLLANKNPHPWDITVQSHKHVYSVRWVMNQNQYVQDAVSMTTFIGQMFHGFESEHVLDTMPQTKDGKYMGYYQNKTRAEVKQAWAQANKDGKRAHRLVECYLNGMPCDAFSNIKVFQQFLCWKTEFEKMGMEVFRTEMRIRSSILYKITGAVDSLWIHVNHPPPEECDSTLTLTMVDWKFKRRYWKSAFVNPRTGTKCMGFPNTPCESEEDCTNTHDSLQQAGYTHILETWYTDFPYNGHVYKKVRVAKMICLQMHDTLPCAVPHVVDREKFLPVVLKLFDFRRLQLQQKDTPTQPPPSTV